MNKSPSNKPEARKPVARPTKPINEPTASVRVPRAFASHMAEPEPAEQWLEAAQPSLTANTHRKANWVLRLALGAGGLLVSLGVGLYLEALVRELFARYEWLGWVGIGAVGLFVLAILVLITREILALRRLNNLDVFRARAAKNLVSNHPEQGRRLVHQLHNLYQRRPDMAQPLQDLAHNTKDQFDGTQMLHAAEHALMTSLDTRAKTLTSDAARRVAIVTAISPRALVDIAFVGYESLKLTRAIATLYGGRPGLMSSWRLAGAIVGHLAVTGGVALGESVIQQLLGQGLAAKLSARLGEGLVNGLMTARVGIAATRVTRPLPFTVNKQPTVLEYAGELAKITKSGLTPTKDPK